jgi:hypothetical protein
MRILLRQYYPPQKDWHIEEFLAAKFFTAGMLDFVIASDQP